MPTIIAKILEILAAFLWGHKVKSSGDKDDELQKAQNRIRIDSAVDSMSSTTVKRLHEEWRKKFNK